MPGAGTGAALFTLALSVATLSPPAEPARSFSLVPVAEGVFAAIAPPGEKPSLGNAGFVVGSDGVLVVDAFATPEAASQLLAEIRRRTPLPVRWLVNTNHHRDHVGGNAVFAEAGAVILGRESLRTRQRADQLAGRSPTTLPLVLPAITYADRVSIWLGERRVDVLARPGHTAGDSIVAVPEADVLFGGDLLWKSTVPDLSDANTAEWIDTLAGLLKDHPRASFVPGHGGLARALDVRLFRDYLVGLRLAVARGLRDGKSGASLIETVLPRLQERFGAWTGFERAGENIARAEAELKGAKALGAAPP